MPPAFARRANRLRDVLVKGLTPRAAATAAFAVQLVAVLVVILIAVVQDDTRRLAIAAAVLPTTGVLFAFHLRGHQWPKPALVVSLGLLVGLATPEPYVTQTVTLALLIPAVAALVLGGAFMVPIAAALTWLPLVFRGGSQSPYLDPMTILFFWLIVVFLRIARLTTMHESGQAATEHVLAVRHAAERDAARKQSEERARMFNVLAHELNNVITPLNIQLHLVEVYAGETITGQQRKSFDVLKRAKLRTTALINDMLDYARVETGNLKLVKGHVDAARLVHEAVETYRPLAEREQVSVEVQVTNDAQMDTDPNRASQILSNLLSNAIKYSPRGGSVVVNVDSDAQGVHMAVRDRGVGLTTEQQTRLFQPFSQVHSLTGAQRPGTGLGLYISRQLATRLGGDLRCQSAGAGHGAEFVLDLPEAPATSFTAPI